MKHAHVIPQKDFWHLRTQDPKSDDFEKVVVVPKKASLSGLLPLASQSFDILIITITLALYFHFIGDTVGIFDPPGSSQAAAWRVQSAECPHDLYNKKTPQKSLQIDTQLFKWPL